MIPNNPKMEDLLNITKKERKFKINVFIKLRKQHRQEGREFQCLHLFRTFLNSQGYTDLFLIHLLVIQL